MCGYNIYTVKMSRGSIKKKKKKNTTCNIYRCVSVFNDIVLWSSSNRVQSKIEPPTSCEPLTTTRSSSLNKLRVLSQSKVSRNLPTASRTSPVSLSLLPPIIDRPISSYLRTTCSRLWLNPLRPSSLRPHRGCAGGPVAQSSSVKASRSTPTTRACTSPPPAGRAERRPAGRPRPLSTASSKRRRRPVTTPPSERSLRCCPPEGSR